MATQKQHKIAEKISKLLDKPKDWEVDNYDSGNTYKLNYKHSNISLWMSGGIWFFRIYYPTDMSFPFWESIKLWKKAKPIFKELSRLQEEKRAKYPEDAILKELNKN